MANREYGAVFVCSREVDLERLVLAMRTAIAEGVGYLTREDGPVPPDALPLLPEDGEERFVERAKLQGMPVRAAAPWPGKAVWVFDPPATDRHDEDECYERGLAHAAGAFEAATTFLLQEHGSTGRERFVGHHEIEDPRDDPKAPGLFDRLAGQLGVDVGDLRDVVNALDLRPGAVTVGLDASSDELRAASARLREAMGADPRPVEVAQDRLHAPTGEEAAAERAKEPGRAEAEARAAGQVKVALGLLLATLVVLLVFILLARRHAAGSESELRRQWIESGDGGDFEEWKARQR